jgi:hypothetical protein
MPMGGAPMGGGPMGPQAGAGPGGAGMPPALAAIKEPLDSLIMQYQQTQDPNARMALLTIGARIADALGAGEQGGQGGGPPPGPVGPAPAGPPMA